MNQQEKQEANRVLRAARIPLYEEKSSPPPRDPLSKKEEANTSSLARSPDGVYSPNSADEGKETQTLPNQKKNLPSKSPEKEEVNLDGSPSRNIFRIFCCCFGN